MADALGPDGNRVTLKRSTGHQIRLINSGHVVKVSCLCQEHRAAPWASRSEDGAADHWRLYNALPHDQAAGDFTPVDETTGETLTGPGHAAL